jgi:hypothetical protein
MREKILFVQKYKKHSAFVNKDALPVTKHTAGYQPSAVELVAAGRVQMENGEVLEFQDCRMYFPVQP